MPKTRTVSASPTNRLLAALPKEEYQQLLPRLEPFPLVFGEVIYEPGDLIRNVYFPTSGIISLLAAVEDRATLEVGIVGREGMVGLPAFMGVKTSGNRAVVQGVGAALRMKAKAFRKECENGSFLSRLLRRYSHSRLTQIAQGAACNRFLFFSRASLGRARLVLLRPCPKPTCARSTGMRRPVGSSWPRSTSASGAR